MRSAILMRTKQELEMELGFGAFPSLGHSPEASRQVPHSKDESIGAPKVRTVQTSSNYCHSDQYIFSRVHPDRVNALIPLLEYCLGCRGAQLAIQVVKQ